MFAFEHNDPQLPVSANPEPLFHDDVASPTPDRAGCHTFQYLDAANAMDVEEPARLARNIARSPPIQVTSQSPARTPLSKPAPGPALPETLNFDQVRSNAAKKKKKKRANKTKAAAPALQTIRGFQTPVTSGGEESDMSVFSTPKLGPRKTGLESITSSPALRPTSACGGISNLKAQLDKLSLGSTATKSTTSTTNASSNGSLLDSSASESGRTELESYDVDLDEDFASPDAEAKSSRSDSINGTRQDSLARKMCADDFETISCLGKGSYGTVLLVRQRSTGRLFAQKQLRKATLTVHKKLVEQTKTERVILENVNRHPFVVKLYYAFQDHEKLYLILEYAQGGELFHHLAMERMFTEEVAAFYMAEMVLALEHLHRNVGVVYRDLKPENCLLDSEGHLLLTDFGLSKVAVDESDTCSSMLGTAEYMAPEVIQGKDYGMAVDWWSLGALGVDLLTGSPPFTANNNAKVQEKIVKQKLQLPYFLGPDAKDLLTRLLRKEPSKRLGANMPKDLHAIKSHRFFRRINWAQLAKRELEPPIQPLITDPELAENFSKDFTELALSPVVEAKPFAGAGAVGAGMDVDADVDAADVNLFGGFSFVASNSLLQCGDWGQAF